MILIPFSRSISLCFLISVLTNYIYISYALEYLKLSKSLLLEL